MDKRTLLAVVLSVIVITVGFIIQSTFFMPPPEERAPQPASTAEQDAQAQQAEEDAAGQQEQAAEQQEQEEPAASPGLAESSSDIRPYGEDPNEQQVVVDTEVLRVVFTNRGAKALSIKLKKHKDEGKLLEMVESGKPDQGAFTVAFGPAYTEPVNATFNVRRIDEYTVEFTRQFAAPDETGTPVPFTLTKRFDFTPDEYMFELRVRVKNSVNALPPLDFNGYSYTLEYGPQIGPEITNLDGRYEYRRYYTYADGNRERYKLNGGETTVQERVMWAALAGKYFTTVGIPDATKYDITFSEKPVPGVDPASRMFFSRPRIKSSTNVDLFQFYVGPKLARVLSDYNNADQNAFKASNLHLEEVMDTSSILGWLEWILKKMMVFFHSIVPNWGIAIMMLTIAIKIVLFPITHKSYESTSKMQALNPKIKEIREQYKDNPNKMNQEMAALYKQEGVNPLGGCLPLLLQMPIFIALYGLLNKHFDLRGATFIPGWISDLSSPESILSFAPFQVPILGWSDLRLLPILFAGSIFLSSKLMQSPAASGQGGSMKMMTYGMPFFLFFVLYNAPSGLLVYWIMTNLLTMVQQKFIAKRQRQHGNVPAVATAAEGQSSGSSSPLPPKAKARAQSSSGKSAGSKTGKGGGKKQKSSKAKKKK
jgi:YidC/Oxa1 family membrane protein insertase